MEEWKEYKLGEVCSRLRSGKGIKADFISNTGKYPVIGGNGVRGYTDSYNFEGQAAVIGRQGAYCGNVRFYEGQAHMTEHAVVVVGNELADTFFLACVLSRMHLGNLSGQSAQPVISVQTLSKQTLRLPSIVYQKQVSDIIKSLDDKIAVNKKICENLEAQAQVLFKHWFIDFAPFKDGNFCANREQNETCFNSAEVQPKITGKACKFVESELGLIPEGWKVGTLGDLVIEVKKKVGSSSAKVLSPINAGKLVLSDEFFTKQVYSKSISKYIVVEPNDFAYNPARVNIGSIGRNEFDFTGCVSPVYVVFRCNEYYHYFIDFLRKTQYFKNNVNKLAIGGVRQTLRYEDMARIPTVIPPVEIVISFNDVYESMYVKLKQLHSENLRLASLRDTLLPKLMSGEIKVNEIAL